MPGKAWLLVCELKVSFTSLDRGAMLSSVVSIVRVPQPWIEMLSLQHVVLLELHVDFSIFLRDMARPPPIIIISYVLAVAFVLGYSDLLVSKVSETYTLIYEVVVLVSLVGELL